MLVAHPLSTNVVTPSEKDTKLVRHDLPLVKPCWLSPVTSLLSMCLSVISRRICSIILPGTEMRLTVLQFPRSSFFPFLKMGVMLPLLQSVPCSVLGPSLQERHRGAGVCPKKCNKAGEGSRTEVLREADEGTGVVQAGEQETQGNLISLYNYLEGGCSKVGGGFFSQVTRDSMRGNSLKLPQGRFRLVIGNNFFIERIVKHWNRLPREVVDSPSLEVFKRPGEVSIRDMVQWWTWQCYINGWT